jgi:hypothetical protein
MLTRRLEEAYDRKQKPETGLQLPPPLHSF